jgi:pimeloyl-ACP methyl ester carboxylesterase
MDALLGERREATVSVRDGRVVGFAEWGDPDGRPVVTFHGGPGSRLLALGCEEAAERLGLRLVCLERPGFGLSDFAPDRTLIGWTDDVADAIRGLELDRPAVVGVSAGSPYALACAACLPLVVSRVGVIGGLAPAQFRAEDPFTDLVSRDRQAAEAAARRHFEAMAADIEASVADMSARAGPDQAIYSRADVQERFRQTRREAFRGGIDGAVLDLMLLHEPWGFELHDIAVPTRWWHGSLDAVSPVEAVRAATAGIRGLELTVYPGEGHAINFRHGVEILKSLTQLT